MQTTRNTINASPKASHFELRSTRRTSFDGCRESRAAHITHAMNDDALLKVLYRGRNANRKQEFS
ncbi:FIG00455325: hypothetical protein [Burkholderia singularis]|uniref:Response regulator SirA n=1 Tax=Burkholderia singularis TaxID=1503053 RepID=A0A238HBI7_9BURK|nr:FIG00455325: hypothetical protein [Burkholderia singularis]